MLAGLEALRAFLARDLPIHIAKEEKALFPAIRGMARLIEEMVEQHDEIRLRRSLIVEMLAVVETHRNDILPEGAAFVAALERVASHASSGGLGELHDRVVRLDWILQGHFDDEEDDLLLPAATLLSTDDLAQIAAQMDAIAEVPR